MVREQRATMVQTVEQYRFIYHAISSYMKMRRAETQEVLVLSYNGGVIPGVKGKNYLPPGRVDQSAIRNGSWDNCLKTPESNVS